MSAQQRQIAGIGSHQDFDRIQRQIVHRAKRLTVTAGVQARWRRRHGRRWTCSDRVLRMEHANRLAFERRAELEALMESGTCTAGASPSFAISR